METLNEILKQCPDFYDGESFANGYIKGYHQAEKDLELSGEDINDIIRIYEDVLETEFGENIYIEVLKRFKNLKK